MGRFQWREVKCIGDVIAVMRETEHRGVLSHEC